MFKVLIIEDEFDIRKGIIEAVNWEEIGCRVCGEADSGLTGLEKYIETNPDIVLTDIVMPGIDGITFLRHIKDKNKHLKVILITGHRNFEYAQDAVNIGASVLLLKPIDLDELTQQLKNFVMQLKQEKNTSSIRNSLSDKSGERVWEERNIFLCSLMKGVVYTPTNIHKQCEKYGILMKRYVVATASLDYNARLAANWVNRQNAVKNLHMLIDNMNEYKDEVFPLVIDDTYISLILSFSGEVFKDKKDVAGYIELIQQFIRNTFPFGFSFGISNISSDIIYMYESFTESLEALEERFYSGENSLNYYERFNREPVNMDKFSLIKYNTEILSVLKSCTGRELNKKTHKIFDDIMSCVTKDASIIKGVIISLLNGVIKNVYGSDSKYTDRVIEKFSYFKNIIECNYVYSIKDIFTDVVIELFDYVHKKKDDSKQEVMAMIMKYLQEKYSQNIMLNEIADYIYFSPAYTSSLIKNETGKSFTDLLSEIRVEKSKELLLNANLKSYEIAERVGINDSHYFSQVFKKYTGMTPTEFQDKYKICPSSRR